MDSKEKVLGNFIWKFFERSGAQIVSFIVSVVLARLLAPEYYGTVALVTLITAILQVFVDGGMANALIQKKDTDELDYSSVFYFNVCFCLVLYTALFFAAPLIAQLYRVPELTPMVRVLGLSLIFSGFRNVQQAYVSKTMQFKRFFFSTLGSTIASAIVGISLAYAGYGVWALVAQQLVNAAVSTAILWLTVKWHPRKIFSLQRLKGLLSYGWKLLVSELLDTGYNKLREFIVGFKYGTVDLALYNKANTFPTLLVDNINTSVMNVMLPVLSSTQDDSSKVYELSRRTLTLSCYIIMPLMAGLAAVAEPMIIFLLTDKWIGCVPYIRIFCLAYAFFPVHTANLNALKAMGRSDLFLLLEIIKKSIALTLIVLVLPYGPFALALSFAASSLMEHFINSQAVKKVIGYSYLRQLRDILPTLLLSLLMFAAVSCLNMLELSPILTLLIQIPAGVGIYVLGSALFNIESFRFILGFLKRKSEIS